MKLRLLCLVLIVPPFIAGCTRSFIQISNARLVGENQFGYLVEFDVDANLVELEDRHVMPVGAQFSVSGEPALSDRESAPSGYYAAWTVRMRRPYSAPPAISEVDGKLVHHFPTPGNPQRIHIPWTGKATSWVYDSLPDGRRHYDLGLEGVHRIAIELYGQGYFNGSSLRSNCVELVVEIDSK